MSLSMTPHCSWAEPRVSPSLALTCRVTSNITHSVTLTGQMHALGAPPPLPTHRAPPIVAQHASHSPPRCCCSKHRQFPYTDAQMMPRTPSVMQFAHRTRRDMNSL